ncbi:MAG TPA: MerR family transcriptional regulator, partial [Methylocella sp.]|nr:MerR family transcriptional regulator [Methylocella sp.]
TIRALRFYEDRGLLRPRREGSVRWYDDRDRLRLKMILRGKLLGFTLAEINDVLAGRGEENGKAELELELTPGQIAAQISHLEQQRSQIEEAIATLREAQQRLLEVQSSEKRSDRSDP